MNKDNIYLIGMMGSGKTTIGQLLAKKMNLEFLDMDSELEHLMDMSISMIFSQYGEKRFRMIESSFFREVSKVGKLVYATGGGIILNQSNQKIIKEGIAIFLDCSLNELISRVKKDKKSRPLIHDDVKKNMSILYNERYKLYENCAKYIIDTTAMSTTQVADEIIQCIN